MYENRDLTKDVPQWLLVKLGDYWLHAENRILREITRTGRVDFRIGNTEKEKDRGLHNDPVNVAEWQDRRTVRADLLRWLIADQAPAEALDPKGVTILVV